VKTLLLNEASKIWNKISIGEKLKEVQLELDLQKKLMTIFEVGDSYFYVFDLIDMKLDFMSKETEKLLGYPPNQWNMGFLLEKIHPDDQPWFLNIENKATEFFATLSMEQIPNYKLRYDYRIQKSNGDYIRVLQQVVALQYSETGRILKSFGVHTDISHIKMKGDPVLSFIGLNGEPSFINVDVEKNFKVSSEFLSKRESEILTLLVDGNKTKDIAKALSISEATVSTHRKNLLAKTKAKTTSEMIVMAITNGWV